LIIFLNEAFAVRNKREISVRASERGEFNFSPSKKAEQLLIDDYPRSKGEWAECRLTGRAPVVG